MQAQLEVFEQAVYGRKKENRIAENQRALECMLQCLKALREGQHFEKHDLSNVTADYTRMASAIVALFVDPGFVLTGEGFQHVCAERGVMETLFKASTYQHPDFIFQLVAEDAEHVNKFLLFFTTDSVAELPLEETFRNDPQGTFGLYLSLLGYGQVFTQQAHERRERLIEMAPIFKDVRPPTCLYNALCGAYMHLSYASAEGKHAPKRMFHQMLQEVMADHVNQAPVARARKDKPTIVIMFEWWHSMHAMYRSYAKSIEQLKRDFRIIGTCPGQNSDDASKAMFDEWIPFSGETMVMADIAKKVQEANPDIIYYPSIGMGIWNITMASLRLAPIQVMTYGHPATTNSPVIDYGLIEADCYTEGRFSERVITIPPNTVKPTRHGVSGFKHAPKRKDTIRIGVAAMQVKVSWPLVQALQKVQAQAHKKVEVWFFSAVHGAGMYSMLNDMQKMIANLTIQEMQNYQDYMQTFAQCDIALFSFPFGGANSMYDAIELGLPMVTLLGDEPHSMSDTSILRRAGLPEYLVAHNEEQYVNRILRLLNDEDRIEVAKKVAAVDMEKLFFAPDDSMAFVDAFSRIYRENTVEEKIEEAA
jgi:hypothetical protein